MVRERLFECLAISLLALGSNSLATADTASADQLTTAPPTKGLKAEDPPIYRKPAFPFRPLGTPPRGFCWLGHYPDVPYSLHPIWEVEFDCEGTFGNPKLIVMPNGECVCIEDPDFDPLNPYLF